MCNLITERLVKKQTAVLVLHFSFLSVINPPDIVRDDTKGVKKKNPRKKKKECAQYTDMPFYSLPTT